MSTSDAKKIAKKYAEALKKDKFIFSNVYLFGSHAMGRAKKYSDIDIAIIIKHIGSDKKYIGKKMRLWEITPDVDTRIEPILIDEKDFKKGTTAMAYEVKKHGIKVE